MNPNQSPREDVLSAIKAGKVKMRSRSYFVFWGGVFVLTVLTLTLIFLYFVVLAFAVVDLASLWFATSFGPAGFTAFIWSVPWIVLLVIGSALLVIQALIRRYPIVYQLPLAISLILLLIFGVLGGLLLRLVETTIIERPIIDPFVHRGLLESGSQVAHGVVLGITDLGFVLETSTGELAVVMDEKTTVEFGLSISSGDEVLVFGQRNKEIFHAVGVKKVK